MLYVIIATLNNLPHTKFLLDALRVVTAVPVAPVLIDNGSTDGTREYLHSLGDAITYIANEGNIGAAGAWNLGLRYVVANGGDLVLICGNDTCPMPGTIERLLAAIQAGAAFVTGTQVPYSTPVAPVPAATPGDVLSDDPDFSFLLMRLSVVMNLVGHWDLGLEIQRFAELRAKGESMIVPFANPHDYGLFDTRYRNGYFEDNDYHLRAAAAGVPCLRDPFALFRHDASLTIRTVAEVGQQNQATFLQNAELFKRKWGKAPYEMELNQARPLNVTDEQWQRMYGNRPVQQVNRAELAERAKALYAQYGITA